MTPRVRVTPLLPLVAGEQPDRMVERSRALAAVHADAADVFREWGKLYVSRIAIVELLWSLPDGAPQARAVVKHLVMLNEWIECAWQGSQDGDALADVLRSSSLFGPAPRLLG